LRRLSTPVLTSTAVAVADFQGYLHWLDKTTGELVARERVAKERITNSPVAVGDTIVVLTDAGKLAAFRATPTAPAAKPAAAVAAPEAPASSVAAPEAPAAAPAPTPANPATAPPTP
ncbi:MAG TPA: PQQ-binding-like beta-propeller repeat protein, partial [Steroidobacteraceae bacterium]